MIAPGSRIGPATDAERQALRGASTMGNKYDETVDRESAYEVLAARAQGDAAVGGEEAAVKPDSKGKKPGAASGQAGEDDGLMGAVNDFLFGSVGPRGGRREGVVQSAVKSAIRSTATQLVRGILGSLVGGRSRR
jgi:hypothetical protein